MSAFDKQVGGSHYKEYVIQPYEFFFVNKIPHHKAAIIRRILRHDHPTGKGDEDLEKIIHEVALIRELGAMGRCRGEKLERHSGVEGENERDLPSQGEIATKWNNADRGVRDGVA